MVYKVVCKNMKMNMDIVQSKNAEKSLLRLYTLWRFTVNTHGVRSLGMVKGQLRLTVVHANEHS